MKCAIWLLGASILSVATLASSQNTNVGSHSSQSDLTVRVRLQSEEPPPTPLQVQLRTVDGIPLFQDFTHDDGRVDFRNVYEGQYRITVSGTGYTTYTAEPFTILHNEHSHSEVVYVVPKAKAGEASSPGTVSAYDLKVPGKAKEKLEQAAKEFSAGRADKAIETLLRAIEIYPPYAQAYNNLGVALIGKGDLAGAAQAFEQSLKINEKFAPGMVNLARLELRQQNIERAGALADKALSLEPNSLAALAILAHVKFYQGSFGDAVGMVNRIHGMPHEDFAEVHLVAAEAYQKEGKNDEALNECRLFLKEAPKSPKAQQVRNAMKSIEARK